jgi:C-terminal processing protease CtpA/Prc
MNFKLGAPALAGMLFCALFSSSVCWAQKQQTLSKDEQSQISEMMRTAHDDVKNYYYDPKLGGLDWDARYRQYDAMIAKAHNMGDGFRLVAAFLGGLKDSHTFFNPPERANIYEAGYRMTLEGNDAFITQVRPGTEAESKLHIGDQIVTMDGYNVNRDDYHDLRYFFGILSPQPAAQFDLLSPAGEERKAVVSSIVKPRSRLVTDLTNTVDAGEFERHLEDNEQISRSRVVEIGDVAIWQVKQFFDNAQEFERAISIARKHKAFIIDLRGNPGGSTETLSRLVSTFFDHDVKICDRVGKKDHKPMIAQDHGQKFTGQVIVLVDSGSASCSELFARVMQLEHRGTVIGDRTSGAVMESRHYSEKQGFGTIIVYGFSVTQANLIMSDGKSLEKIGVTPDELMLPTAADLAAGRDPVLAHAMELAGVKLDPAAAGKLFPFEWPPLQ